MADYNDYQARTFLTQSMPCDDWDAINASLQDLYDKGKLGVEWEDVDEPHFYLKNDDD